MKFKDFEGSPEEINNFFQNNGLNVSEYLNISKDKKADSKWIYILIALFICFNIVISFIDFSSWLYYPLAILTLSTLAGLIAIIHHNYEKTTVSIITGISGLIIMVISYKILTPKEAIKEVKDKSEQYWNDHNKKE